MAIAYYNEHDRDKAAWLRELIKAGIITDGEVDERSIEDVLPNDVAGFTRCHFFAGIGVWDYALQQAGWGDDLRTWTGSCPCQPFSSAGQRKGFDDERHLWPAWFHLIRVCRPDVVFGEQTAKRHGFAWLDLVQSDLEAAAYAVGALGLPAGGFGAPHIRERIFFVADTAHERHERNGRTRRWWNGSADSRSAVRMGNAESLGRIGRPDDRAGRRGKCSPGQTSALGVAQCDASGKRLARQSSERRDDESQCSPAERTGSAIDFLADADSAGRERQRSPQPEEWRGDPLSIGRGPTNGFWRDAEWIYCRDDKYRAIQPGAFPMAHGAAARILRLRGYGDSLCAPVAEEFIRAYIELNS